MIGWHSYRFAAKAAALFLALTLALGVSTASAQRRDRWPPTRPTNLHVTATASFSVSLAWNPSTDNSGSFSYRIHASNGHDATVSQASTSFDWNFGLTAGFTYSFYVYAVDGSGNRSGNSNTVTVTLPRDSVPPTAPVLSVTDVGPSHVALAWTASIDDGPFVWYQTFVNGTPTVGLTAETSATILGLTPSTTYTFTVQARDNGINWSSPSNAVTVTTAPADSTDTQPPTTPGNLFGFDGGCAEAWLTWDQSTDNVDPQFAIRYEIFVNGTFRPESTTTGYGETIAYADAEGPNTFEVFAVDSAGNVSAPASITMQMSNPC